MANDERASGDSRLALSEIVQRESEISDRTG
jgi:hypothetical protein